MTLTQQATLTEEAIAQKLAQLQIEIKQLNPDYELRPIGKCSRRWQKNILYSYSIWRKGMPGVKKFVLADYGNSRKDLERRNRALDAVAEWIKERRETKPVEIDRSIYPKLPSVVPFSYDDVAQRFGEIISADLKQGDIVQVLYSPLPPMVVVSHPVRRVDMIEFEAFREGEGQFFRAFQWRWKFQLVGRQSSKAA